MSRYAKMIHLVDALCAAYPEDAWSFATLTVRNCRPAELSHTIDEMMRGWNRLMARKAQREAIHGYARALEVTYNKETQEVHPHIHVLVMWRDTPAADAGEELIDSWMQAVRCVTSPLAQDVQDIRSPLERGTTDAVPTAVLETYKYSVKSSDLADMPLWIFRETAEALAGRRLVSFGGLVKDMAAACEIDIDKTDDEADGEQSTGVACQHCGADMVRCIGTWCGSQYVWRTRDGKKIDID